LLATTLEENDHPPAGPFGTATPAARWWWCIAFFAFPFFFGEKKEGRKIMVKTGDVIVHRTRRISVESSKIQ